MAPGVFVSKKSDNSAATSLTKLVVAVVVPIAAIAIGLVFFFMIRSIRKKRRARAKADHAAESQVDNPFSAGPGKIGLSQRPMVQIGSGQTNNGDGIHEVGGDELVELSPDTTKRYHELGGLEHSRELEAS